MLTAAVSHAHVAIDRFWWARPGRISQPLDDRDVVGSHWFPRHAAAWGVLPRVAQLVFIVWGGKEGRWPGCPGCAFRRDRVARRHRRGDHRLASGTALIDTIIASCCDGQPDVTPTASTSCCWACWASRWHGAVAGNMARLARGDCAGSDAARTFRAMILFTLLFAFPLWPSPMC